jgi:hypothetical protein
MAIKPELLMARTTSYRKIGAPDFVIVLDWIVTHERRGVR